ncbi:oligosaccharide flippase family protein [Natrarchaeobius chitinivorans]|uniref:Flippase n=1 Tax=Natrarchaeobius chitinivorans TaxID=1679083 RepID=A0A3N6PF22_NATCH|nr:oligosaccharide flippase family protein [Natrarchaeobius chitinivorans]RQG96045.1 flippase [Natrarchaeobius chitinivorans]
MADETESGIFTLAKQGSVTFFGNILGKVLGFLFVATATRLVTPTEYGVYTLTLSIVLFIQGFVSLNIYRSVDYFIPQFLDKSEYGKAKGTLRNVFIIGILSSIAGFVIVLLGRTVIADVFDEPQLVIALTVLALLIPVQTIYKILIASFNSIKRMEYRILMKDLLNPLGRIVAIVVLITSGMGLIGLVGGYLIGVTFAVFIGLLIFIYKSDWLKESETDSVSNRALLSYSLPLVLAGVIYSLVGQIDYFVIGYFLGSEEVGQYQVGFLLASNLLIALQAITPIFKPIVAENMNDNTLLQRRFRLTTRWITILTIPPALTLVLAPEPYLSLLFTDQYTAAATAVAALSVGYLLNASFGPEGMMLEGLGHTRLTLLNTVVLVIVNATLDVLLVPELGILGAGIATGTALTVAGIAGVIEVYYFRGIHPFTKRLVRVWTIGMAPLSVGIVIVYLIDGFLLIIALPVLIVLSFVMGLRLIGGFTSEDALVADRFDDRIGYPLVKSLLMPDVDK